MEINKKILLEQEYNRAMRLQQAESEAKAAMVKEQYQMAGGASYEEARNRAVVARG